MDFPRARSEPPPARARAGIGLLRVAIAAEPDVILARQLCRQLAAELGFDRAELTVLAAVISELARTVFAAAGDGEIQIRGADGPERRGLLLEARGGAAGRLAGGGGKSELVGLERSLTAVRRLVDEFEVRALPGGGTAVRVTKWMR